MTKRHPDMTVLKCWRCSNSGNFSCQKCQGTGLLFWANGYAFPYTPDGQKLAEKAEAVR